MLVELKFIKGMIFKLKWQNTQNRVVLLCPKPKTKREHKKLKKALLPFSGNIIYPTDFFKSDYPKEYPLAQMIKRKKLLDFLSNCKKTKPKTVVIMNSEMIKREFFFDISPFVGQIILPNKIADHNLQRDVLNFSGTPIIFGGEIPNEDAKTLILRL